MSSFPMLNEIEDWDERPIKPNDLHSSISSTASSADLKSQLSQLQQKLNLNSIRPVRATTNTEPEIHLPPTFSQGNILSTSPNNSTSTTAINVVNHTDKSVDFLGELSDGLLIESRKLSYENKQFKKKLLSLTTENDLMKKQISNLNLLNNQLSEKEEESNDKIWNLETEINNFKRITEKTKLDLSKIQNEYKESTTLIDELKSSIDVLKNEKLQLSDNSNLSINKLNNKLDELKEENENLNDENDILHKNILDLKNDLTKLKSEDINTVIQPEISFAEFDDSIIQDPIPLKLYDDDVSKLDNETLQKNLKLSYRQLLKLKNQNSKIKSDLLKLKHKSPSKKNNNQILNTENEIENSWANFTDDSFVKQKSQITSNVSNIILSDDELENDNSFFNGSGNSSSSISRKSSISKPTESFMLIVPKTTLESIDSDIDLKKIDLTEFQTIQLSNSLANQLLSSSTASQDNKNKFKNNESLQLIPENELNSLANPSIDYIKFISKDHNCVYIPADEHQKQISDLQDSTSKILELENLSKEQSDSLSKIENQLNQTLSELESKTSDYEDLKVKYENPSLDFMKKKLFNHNYIMLDATSHKNIQNRIEGLQNKIQDSNKNLISLKKTIDQLNKEKSELEERIRSPEIDYMKDKATLLHYAFLPETEHIQLETQLTVIEAKLKQKENEIYNLSNAKSEADSKIEELESIIANLKQSCSDYQSKMKSFENLIESPDVDYIKTKSSNHNLIAVSIDEHNRLEKELSDYSDKVEKLLSEADVAKSENSNLSSIISEKELLLNSFKLELDSLKENFLDLQNKSENPDAEYIKSKASLHDLTVVPTNEHESLKEQLVLKDTKLADYSKLQEELKNGQEEINKLIQSKEELSKSIEEATNNLESRESELDILKKKLESPSIEYVKEKSQSHGFITITKDEHEKLQSELTSNADALAKKERELSSLHLIKVDIERQAEIQGSKSVSLELHESVQNDLNQTRLELDDHKKEVSNLKQVEIELSKKESELSKLIEKASELEAKAAKIDEVTFELNKLKNVKNELDEKHQELDDMKTREGEMQSHITLLKGKEDELLKTLQELDSKNTELESLKSLYEKPTFDYIYEKSKSLGHVPVTLEEHSLSQSNLDKLELGQKKNIELEDKIVLLSSKNNELSDLNASLDKNVSELSKLKDMLDSPDVHYIKEKAVSLGLITLPVSDHDLLNKNIETLSSNLESLRTKIAEIESEKVELNEKIKTLEHATASPSIDYIQSKSASLGIIPIPIVEHTSLKSELQRKDILLKENKQQLEEFELLKKDASTKRAELDDVYMQLDNITASYESPSLYYLKDKLSTLNYVAITESDYVELEHIKDESIKTTEELSDKLKCANTELEEKNKQLELISTELESTKTNYEAQVAVKPEELDESKLRDIAASKGMTLLTIADINKGYEMGKSSSVATVTSSNVNNLSSQPIENIIEYLEPKGYTIMTNEEYATILKTHPASSGELDNLANISHDLSDIESDIESKKHILEELETRSRHDSIISSSSSITSVPVSVSVENVLSEKYRKLNDTILNLSKEIDDLHQDKVKISKQINRLSVSPEEYNNNALTKKLNKKIANIDGMLEVKAVELKSQQSALTAVHAYLEKAKGLNLAPVTSTVISSNSVPEISDLEKEILELQTKYDMKKQEMDRLAHDISNSSEPSQLVERLSLLGYSVVSPTGDNSMVKGISLNGNNILITAIFNSDSFNTQSGILTLDSFVDEHGYSILPTTELKDKEKLLDVGELSLGDIEVRARELGYTVVSNQKMNLIIAKSNEPKLPDSFTQEELEVYAKKLDLRIISDDDIERLKARTITSRELASKAEELNLLLLSPDEVDDLKIHEPVTAENIVEKGKNLGIMCIPLAQFVATTVSRTPDIPNVTVLPNSYYKILTKSHEWYKKNKDNLGTPPPAPTPVVKPKPPTIQEDDSFDLSAIMQRPTTGGQHLPANFDAVSLHTVDTIISNRKVIIAAVAQTIMGEYLFKYYRKLGPFSSVSDTRHERYFWIHPYSMTIYWSPLNPVSSDPAKNQIKALSILDVKVVEDNNPLPVGIYHKSLIIKSHDKNIKITCPTRQLHNVWYNSLRFLLDRSTDTWVNDDDLEDQYQQDFTLDNKTKLERSQTQKFKRISGSPSFTSRGDSRIASRTHSMRTLRK